MPPRYAYWTILVDSQPTAFRAGSQEELLPTFNRLKLKNPSAEMKWWQNGKLWESRVDAQEAMRARGEMGRKGDFRQSQGGFRDRDRAPRSTEPREERDPSGKLGWKPKGEFTPAPPRSTAREDDREWKPKRSFKSDRPARPEWKSKSSDDRPRRSEKPEWKPKGTFKSEAEGRGPRRPVHRSATREGGSAQREGGPAKPEWKSKSRDDRPRSAWKPKGAGPSRERSDRREKPEWKPKGTGTPSSPQALRPSGPPKRKWVPKEEFEKSRAAKVPRDKNWRPGGVHKDPKQKYKDAKKAKWGRFKQTIRKRWEGKQGGKKKKDDE